MELALAIGARRGELLALEMDRLGLGIGNFNDIPKSAIAALQFLRDQQQEHQRLFAGDYRDLGLIFCKPDGRYHDPDLVSQVIIRRMRKAGVKEGSIHTLRHTHASSLLSRGDTNITARVYSHALPADDQRAADAWDNIIEAPVQ